MTDQQVREAASMTCSQCGCAKNAKPTRTGETRLPRGWKRHNGVWCDKCWRGAFVLRAISIPVVRPLGEGIGWPQLREAVNTAWSQATMLANWASTESYARDVRREAGMEKLPPAQREYLYPDARARFPDIPSQVVAGTLQKIQGNYFSQRYEVVWTCEASLKNYRYPQPAATPNQGWTASYQPAGKDGGDQVPCVSVTLPGGRFLLQLRGGREFARQMGDFRKIVSGDAVQGELSLYRQRADNTRNGGQARDSGSQKINWRLMVKMVAWFPRTKQRQASGTLLVKTDPDSFLMALDIDGNKIWWLHADHVRRWTATHSRQLQRWSDDQKAEQRPTASFQSRREADAIKFRNRIGSFIKEASAQLANFARRRRYATVKLDDTCRDYLPRFDWSGFRSRLATKLNEHGIILELASDEVVAETPGDAREEISQ